MEPPVETSDQERMLRVRAGDREAFNVLAEKYRTPGVHFLYRMVREPALAEELAQEVFLRIYRAQELPAAGEVFDLALPHRHQRRAQLPARLEDAKDARNFAGRGHRPEAGATEAARSS